MALRRVIAATKAFLSFQVLYRLFLSQELKQSPVSLPVLSPLHYLRDTFRSTRLGVD